MPIESDKCTVVAKDKPESYNSHTSPNERKGVCQNNQSNLMISHESDLPLPPPVVKIEINAARCASQTNDRRPRMPLIYSVNPNQKMRAISLAADSYVAATTLELALPQ
jgi:hypothetical protein